MKLYLASVIHVYTYPDRSPKYAACSFLSGPQKEKRESVTFSFDGEGWLGGRVPEDGDEVVLGDVIRKKGGWRAYHARPRTPEDTDDQFS